MDIIGKIEVDLGEWSEHYPTGIVVYDVHGEVVDSDYRETAEEFIDYLKKYEDKIRKQHPKIQVILDIDDLDKDESSAIDCCRKIKEYCDNVRRRI